MAELPLTSQSPRLSGPMPPVRPQGGTEPPAEKPPARGDRLSLSSEARSATRGPAVETDLSDRDVTAKVQFNDKLSLTGRYITQSPTMMQGAGLLKLDYRLGSNTTVFAGAGYMPGFFHQSIGPNERVDAPTSAAFVGLQDQRSKDWELGNGFRAELGLTSFAVATVAYDHASGALDPNIMAGLSKGTVTGEATLSKQLGGATAWVGYGNHLDVGQIGTYYVTGGTGLFPQTHFVEGGVKGEAGGVQYEAAAYVPISTATNDFAADPKFTARVSGQYLPDLTVVASPKGLDRVEASKSFAVGKGWDATAAIAVDQPGSHPQYRAAVGLSFAWGGAKHSPKPLPQQDYRREEPVHAPNGPIRSASPHLSDFFTPAQIQAMRGKPVADLAQVLKTPEQVAAYVGDVIQYDDARLSDAKGNYGSMTPNEVATLLTGVCRDQHPMLLEVMREGQGVQGHAVGYASPETSHAIAVYQDPKSGKWNVIEYGRVHYTEADTAEAAFVAIRPDALVSGDWSQNGPDQRNEQKNIHYSETAREFYRFVQTP